ncbi:unnamed protein product [Allacma fusca]|uniref:Carboxypeptidase Q n=1 Tax=Allacma fusca TaxID=39272 RepID=A0A8J2NWB9_9HEXA|nr:unnamed protein product [Allacma fusca]
MHQRSLFFITSDYKLSEFLYFDLTFFCDSFESVSPEILKEIRGYQDVADKIIDEVLNGKFKGHTYDDLADFVDNFGNRIAGSVALENAIDYLGDRMRDIGFDNVHTENVTSPKWVRGFEEAVMLKPWRKTISVLGLAMSISTPEEGITGEVIVVQDFEDLHARVRDATNKILVFNAPFDNPENAIKYRQRGAIEGAKINASAVLVRSYATYSLATPHTGLMFYDGDVQKIPAGEISIEDAELLYRLQKKGQKPIVHIKLRSNFESDIITRNTIGDMVGTTKPHEFVLISGHADSYDVGQGALDDGYGVIVSIKAVELLKALKLKPKRTIRTILWTAEEVGEVPFGAAQYLEKHLEELRNNYTMFLESDSGIHNVHGLIFNGTAQAQCIMQEVLQLLAPINATKLYSHFPRLKTDIVPLMQATGVSGALPATDADKYFWAHHSAADTMTFLNPRDLDICLAMCSVLSYVLGDISIMLPRAVVL